MTNKEILQADLLDILFENRNKSLWSLRAQERLQPSVEVGFGYFIERDGEDYRREVKRVLAKMPKWIPAIQNGTKVATWFTQPVSFIGVE